MNVRARNCRDLLSLQRSYRGLARRSNLLSLRPRRVRGLQLVAACCCHTTAAVTTVGCLPDRPHHSRREGTGSNVGYQIPSVGASVWEKLARALRRLARAVQLLLRALGVGLLFCTPAVSGSIVYVLHRLPGFPRGISTQLCDWWWRLLLNVVDRSGPTFIKVQQCFIGSSIGWYSATKGVPNMRRGNESRGSFLPMRNFRCLQPLSTFVVDEHISCDMYQQARTSSTSLNPTP